MSSRALAVIVEDPPQQAAVQSPDRQPVRQTCGGTSSSRSRRVARRRDPLTTLATLIAEAFAEKLGSGNGEQLLKRLSSAVGGGRRKPDLTVAKLINQYLALADGYYRHADGTPAR